MRVLHVTEVDRLLACPHRYVMEREGKWLRKPHAAAIRGSAVHKGRQQALLAAIKGSGDPVEVAGDQAGRYVGEQQEAGAWDVSDPESEAEYRETEDTAWAMARVDAQYIVPSLAPLVERASVRLGLDEPAVEYQMELEVPDSEVMLRGRMDCAVEDADGIGNRDCKTSKSKRNPDTDKILGQWSGYTALMLATHDVLMREHTIDNIWMTVNRARGDDVLSWPVDEEETAHVNINTYTVERTESDAEAFLRRVRMAAELLDMIGAGMTPPAAATGFPSMSCSCCDYVQQCEYMPTTETVEV